MYGYSSAYDYRTYWLPDWDYGLGNYGAWHYRLGQELGETVVVVVTSGRGYRAVSGTLGRVYQDYILLLNGYTVIEIPMDRIAAVKKLVNGDDKTDQDVRE